MARACDPRAQPSFLTPDRWLELSSHEALTNSLSTGKLPMLKLSGWVTHYMYIVQSPPIVSRVRHSYLPYHIYAVHYFFHFNIPLVARCMTTMLEVLAYGFDGSGLSNRKPRYPDPSSPQRGSVHFPPRIPTENHLCLHALSLRWRIRLPFRPQSFRSLQNSQAWGSNPVSFAFFDQRPSRL